MPRKKTKVTVDMKGVTGSVLVPEGDYHCRVHAVEEKEAESSGNNMLQWTFEIMNHADEKLNGLKQYLNTVLVPQALWRLRTLLETMGEEVPDGHMDIEFKEMIDNELMIRIEHEEYEGKMRAKVSDFFPVDVAEAPSTETVSVSDDGKEDGEKGSSKKSGPPKLTEDEVKEMDSDDLAEIVDTYDLDVNLGHKKYKTTSQKRKAVLKALDEDGHLEE